MDRRNFLKIGTAIGAAAVVGTQLAAAKSNESATKARKELKPKGKVRARIGVLSDIHIIEKESTDWFEKALRWFRDRGVDGVIVAGDMADWGTDDQLSYVQDAWNRVFPSINGGSDGLGADGKPVAKLFVTGNHDLTAVDNKRVVNLGIPHDQFIINHIEESWERAFHEPYSPIWKKEVCGFTFIGAHYYNKENIPGLAEFMATAGVGGDKPFFYIQHTHPKDTCSAPWAWGQDDGTTTSILSRFPNCIAFSGHSHTSLTDDRTLWQGAFTSIGTASLRYIIPFGGRENTMVCNSKEKVPSQMPVEQFKDGQQGQYMTIYDNCIVLEKHDFHYDACLGEWRIPLPLSKRPLTFEARDAESVAPQFGAASAAVKVTEADGCDRYGVPRHQFTVHFPTALEPQAFDYEVCAEILDVDTAKTICTKRVMSKGYHLSAANDKAEVTCVFADFELRDREAYHNSKKDFCELRPVRFAIRPVNCYGKKGEALYSPVIEL